MWWQNRVLLPLAALVLARAVYKRCHPQRPRACLATNNVMLCLEDASDAGSSDSGVLVSASRSPSPARSAGSSSSRRSSPRSHASSNGGLSSRASSWSMLDDASFGDAQCDGGDGDDDGDDDEDMPTLSE